jgi:hypothetical protein
MLFVAEVDFAIEFHSWFIREKVMQKLSSKRTRILFATLLQLAIASSCAVLAEETKSNEQRVREFIAAFNSREIDLMLNMVSDDIQWLSVAGDKIVVETQGKAQLGESMSGYFNSTPSARSELKWVQQTATRVAALERANWQSAGGARSQESLCVYEFRDGLIARVYYHPVEK